MKQLIAILCSILIIFIYFVIKKDLINNILFVKTMEVIILSISLLFIGITITKNIEKYFLLSLAALILLAIVTIMIIFSI